MKGLAIWLHNLFLEIVEYIADALLGVFNLDMAYFMANVPVTSEIITVAMGAGWALLLGNLTFQAVKSMMSGIGFEGEDPKLLFTRTFVFAFLLLASRQVCAVGLNMTSKMNSFMATPSAVNINLPQLDLLAFPASWLLIIIINVVLMFQLVRFFFLMAERYVVVAVLTVFAPLAFGVGGSKNTEDIFKGWARLYGSACLMMVFNTAFLKLLLSALSNMPGGTGSAATLLPWMLLVVGLAKVSKKIDDIIARIGLSTARAGDPLVHGGLMYPVMVARAMSGVISKTAATAKGAGKAPKTGTRGGLGPRTSVPPPPAQPSGSVPSNGGSSAGIPTGSAPAGQQTSSAPAPGNTPSHGTYGPGTENGAAPSRPPIGIHGVHGRGDTQFEGQTGVRQADSQRGVGAHVYGGSRDYLEKQRQAGGGNSINAEYPISRRPPDVKTDNPGVGHGGLQAAKLPVSPANSRTGDETLHAPRYAGIKPGETGGAQPLSVKTRTPD
ncbi:MAG: hypothetical protein LBS19_11235, partial [Clostridiales bacterium]|nr:hypothetical protein [Clostridiales bacterium]